MISLIVALLILAAGAYVIVDYKRVKPKIDGFYKQFGKGGRLLMYLSALLALLVFFASAYMAYEWARGEPVPTFQQVGRHGLSSAERYADQLGMLVESGIEDVENAFSRKSSHGVGMTSGTGVATVSDSNLTDQITATRTIRPPNTAPVTGSQHMDFNVGAQQYMWGPNKYPDLYNPQLVDGDGKCHPLVKGYCEGDGHLFKHHSYAQTCNQVTVSPSKRFDSSIHAWMVV